MMITSPQLTDWLLAVHLQIGSIAKTFFCRWMSLNALCWTEEGIDTLSRYARLARQEANEVWLPGVTWYTLPRLDKIDVFQFFSTFAPRLSFLQQLNWCWVWGLIFLFRHFPYTGALPAEKLTILPNCSFHTVTWKAKWIHLGWQCLSEVLHLSKITHLLLNPL